MSAEFQDDPNAPVWGADGWPRQLDDGLDEADVLLIRRTLELTPAERLRALESFVNGFKATGVVAELAGSLKAVEIGDPRADYAEYLAEKYLE